MALALKPIDRNGLNGAPRAAGAGRADAKKILVVDDEESLRQTFEVFLSGAGYDVSASGSAEEALALLRERHFDAVITDIVMPGGDGIALLQAIHEQDTERPVILMTGNPSMTSATAAVRGGAFDYLPKPLKKDQLLQVVRRAVDRYNLIEEKRRLQEKNDEQARTLAEYVRRLESLSAAKDRMAALLVHDFKNPLSVIISNVSMLREVPAVLRDRDALECLMDVESASQGLMRMITMLLDISRMEEAEMVLHLAETALAEVVDASLANFRGPAGLRRVSLESTVPRGLRIPLDRMLIGRVLDNLLSNGLRYTPRGGFVRISASPLGDETRIAVENNGPAIPAAMQGSVFEKYSQVEGEPDRPPTTRGLGLYFCRLAIEAHGGTIRAEDREGGGVRFLIDLPPVLRPPRG